MKVYNIRDAIFEPLINKYYEDPTLVAYGEDVRDWGGAYAVYRGLMDVIPHSRLVQLSDLRGCHRRHRRRLLPCAAAARSSS